MRRAVQVALYVQVLVLLMWAVVMVFGLVKVAAAEPALARRLGLVYLAEAVIVVMVAQLFSRDRRWLLVPILATAVEDANFGFQLLAPLMGLRIPTEPDPWIPLAVIAVFVPIYVVGYARLADGRAPYSRSPAAVPPPR